MEQKKIGYLIDQMQTTLDGMVDRLMKVERILMGSKPSVYIDEQTALLSSEDADIRFIERKVAENEMPEMHQQDRSAGNPEVCQQ